MADQDDSSNGESTDSETTTVDARPTFDGREIIATEAKDDGNDESGD